VFQTEWAFGQCFHGEFAGRMLMALANVVIVQSLGKKVDASP
jgi:hypothetical protein